MNLGAPEILIILLLIGGVVFVVAVLAAILRGTQSSSASTAQAGSELATSPRAIQSADNLSIISLILSIGTVVLGPFGCIPGIICGHIALGKYKAANLTEGNGIARAGVIISYVFLIPVFLLIGLAVVLFMTQSVAPVPA